MAKSNKSDTASTTVVEAAPVLAYKGFSPELSCRGYQYAVGKTFTHHGDVSLCNTGFHACSNPLDVLDYYPLVSEDGSPNRFALVELSGAIDAKSDGDSKVCAASIHIKTELKLSEFLSAGIRWVMDACKVDEAKPGDKVQTASGHSSQLAASGDYSKLAASGDYSKLAASGDYSVIASSSYNGTAKGADGTWIALAEYGTDGKCIGFATGCVGRDGIPADTYLRARDGKLVAVEASA